MLPGLGVEASALAARRLQEESIAWLTTVNGAGQPQTSPIGFVWDEESFLLISSPETPKVRNLRANPKVSLHLDTDRNAVNQGVLTIEGDAVLQPAPPGEPAQLTADEIAAYLDRHLDAMNGAGLTPGEAFAELSTVIRVRPTRARFY